MPILKLFPAKRADAHDHFNAFIRLRLCRCWIGRHVLAPTTKELKANPFLSDADSAGSMAREGGFAK